jgi:hypothetical protein
VHRHPYPRLRGNIEVVFFEGNYADYEADLKRRKGEEAAQRIGFGTRKLYEPSPGPRYVT